MSHECIRKMATTNSVLSEYVRQLKPKKEEEQEQEPPWKDGACLLPLLEELADIKKSYQWLD